MLNLEQYETDKIENDYLSQYEPFFSPLSQEKISLLELGIKQGGSLALWADYFPKGRIAGIDLALPEGDFNKRIQMFQGSQADCEFLSEVCTNFSSDGFDIIIDDASHIGSLSKVSFWHLFKRHLKPGGLYVIEDWGTGYWKDWADGRLIKRDPSQRSWLARSARWLDIFSLLTKGGKKLGVLPASFVPEIKSHQSGMVGFIKQLVDEQGAADASRGLKRGKASRESMFESLTIFPSIVFVRKATPAT